MLALIRQLRSLVFSDKTTYLPSVETGANFVLQGFIQRTFMNSLLGGPETEIHTADTGYQVRTYFPVGLFIFLLLNYALFLLIAAAIEPPMMIVFFFFICCANFIGYRLIAPDYHSMVVKAAQGSQPIKFDTYSALDVFRYY